MTMLEQMTEKAASAMWGLPLAGLLIVAGVYLTIRLRFIQIRRLWHGFQLITGKYDDPDEQGDVSHFQALSAALSATIGTGNIVGVATAVASGGPGAVFWMWITGILGMVNKFASATLGIKFRVIHEDGSASGGPMYYLERGLGQKWLGIIFAFCTMIATFGIGCMVQSNSVALSLEGTFNVPPLATGIVMAALVALIVFGGIRRIGQVAEKLIPLMCVVYVLAALVVIFTYLDRVPAALWLIVTKAFTPQAGLGAFIGITVRDTMRHGLAKGLFSNEGGLGSASIAHSAAKTEEPVREGLVAMVGPLIDTLILCTMTATVIIVTGAWTQVDPETNLALTGPALSMKAFEEGLPSVGGVAIGPSVVTVCLALFAFSTVLSWPYYGDRSAEYLFGPKAIPVFRAVHVVLLAVGAVVELKAMWNLTDVLNGFMAVPNLIGIIGLGGLLAREAHRYFSTGGPDRIGRHGAPPEDAPPA